MARERREKKHAPKKAAAILAELRGDIRSLNSSILIIGQKMKYVVRNEKILGRNLIVLNKKLKALEERILSGEIGGKGEVAIPTNLVKRFDELDRKINELQAELSSIKQGVASQEQLQELRYVIDSINPLELATLQQVKELIAEKMGKRKKKQ